MLNKFSKEKKKICVVFCILLFVLPLLSCKQKGDEQITVTEEKNHLLSEIGTKIKENELVILTENLDYCFYNSFSYGREIVLEVLSKKEINTDKLNVSMDVSIPYKYSVEECEDEFPYYLYASYRKLDWEKAGTLIAQGSEQFHDYIEQYKADFAKIDLKEINKIYRYRITINFEAVELGEEEDISYVTILYDGQQFAKNIGHIKFYNKKNPFKVNGFDTEVCSALGIRMNSNDTGTMTYRGGQFKAKKDVELQNIYLYQSQCKITGCSLDITTPKTTYNQKWESGKSIIVPAGSKLSLDISIENPAFSRNMFCGMNQYLVLEYKQGGKEYRTYMELSFTTQLSAYEAYAYLYDEINIYSYYSNFLAYYNMREIN